MKRIIFLLSLLLTIFLFSCSEDKELENIVDPPAQSSDTFIEIDEAMTIAEQFIDAHELFGPETKSSEVDLNMVFTDLEIEDGLETKSGQKPAYYVFNMENGYVIVSANRVTLPVLGYSTESKFETESMPENIKAILIDFKNEINYARKENIKFDEIIAQARQEYLDGDLVKTKGYYYSVSPLLGSIKWNQSPYYNDWCPTGTPVGCVATATAQIMRYWRYPSSGRGTFGYNSNYGYLSFNYNYRLNWNNMPTSTLRRPNQEVAKFCYGVAVGVKMNFSRGGSGAYQWEVPRLLKENYKYPSNVTSVFRRNYSYNQWASLVRKELSAGRPVQYAGYGSGGGHSFVCDGYNSNGYFHFNWGWGGTSDGYFLLNALNPGSLGTGGGSGGFNSGQEIIINFAPPGGGDGGDDDGDDPDPTPDPDPDPDPDPTPDPDPVPVSYCDANGRTSYYGYIKKVQFGDTYYSSGASSSGYSDFSDEWKFCVRKGQYHYYYLTPGSSYYYSYNMYWKVWVDYNNDGEFSNNYTETLASGYGYSRIYGSFRIPSSVKPGNYRMRVAASIYGYPSPCGEFSYGEVEDHTLCVK